MFVTRCVIVMWWMHGEEMESHRGCADDGKETDYRTWPEYIMKGKLEGRRSPEPWRSMEEEEERKNRSSKALVDAAVEDVLAWPSVAQAGVEIHVHEVVRCR